MKADYNQKIEKLQARLSGLSHPEVNMKDLLDKGIDTLLQADYIYETADTEKKRRLIGSMFPEKCILKKVHF
jgi:site-specific DNA recombinase